MRILRLSARFPVWIMVAFALSAVWFSGCQSEPVEQEAPVRSRAESDGIPKPGAAVAALGGK